MNFSELCDLSSKTVVPPNIMVALIRNIDDSDMADDVEIKKSRLDYRVHDVNSMLTLFRIASRIKSEEKRKDAYETLNILSFIRRLVESSELSEDDSYTVAQYLIDCDVKNITVKESNSLLITLLSVVNIDLRIV